MTGRQQIRRGRHWAREADFGSGPEQGAARYTIFCAFPHESVIEEIDIDATNEAIARELGELVLAADYADGLAIARIEQRFGLYT